MNSNSGDQIKLAQHQISLVQDNELGSYSTQANGVNAEIAHRVLSGMPTPVTLEIIEEGEGRRRIVYAGSSDGLAEAMIHVNRLNEAGRQFKLPRPEEMLVAGGVAVLLGLISYLVVSAFAPQQPSYQQQYQSPLSGGQ